MKLEQTADGSYTLYVPELDEHYHSVKGALTESQHIFIEMGLKHSPVSEPPHSGDRTRNRAECLSDTAFSRRNPTESTLYRYRTLSVSRRNLEATGLPPTWSANSMRRIITPFTGRPGTQKQRYPLGSHYIKLKMILPGFSTRRKAAVPPFPYTISSTLMPSLPKNNPKCGNNLFSILYTRYWMKEVSWQLTVLKGW